MVRSIAPGNVQSLVRCDNRNRARPDAGKIRGNRRGVDTAKRAGKQKYSGIPYHQNSLFLWSFTLSCATGLPGPSWALLARYEKYARLEASNERQTGISVAH